MDEENQQGKPDDLDVTMQQGAQVASAAGNAVKSAGRSVKNAAGSTKNFVKNATSEDGIVRKLADKAIKRNKEDPNNPLGKGEGGDNKKNIKGANSGDKEPGKRVGMAAKGKAKLYKAKGDLQKAKGATEVGLGAGTTAAGAALQGAGAALQAAGAALSATIVGASAGAALINAGTNMAKQGASTRQKGTKIMKKGKSDIDKGNAQKLRGEHLENTGQDIGKGLGDDSSGAISAPKIPGIKNIKASILETTKELKKKAIKFAIIAVAAAVTIILLVLICEESEIDDASAASDESGSYSNVPYVVSSMVLDEIVIVKDSSGNYTYNFQNSEGTYLTLDEAISEALDTLEENGASLGYFVGGQEYSSSEDREDAEELLKKMIEAEIATQYPDISNSEDLGHDTTSSTGNNNSAISGGVTVVRKDENGSETELTYTSSDNFNALISENNESALNYYTMVKSTSTSSSSTTNVSLTGSDYEEQIWNYLIDSGCTEAGAAGIMGNLWKESFCNPITVQNQHNPSEDEEAKQYCENYVAQLDNGTITNSDFAYNGPGGGGFGLAQWTDHNRKLKLYDYIKNKGASFGDLETQLAFLVYEMQTSYSKVWTICTTSNSVSETSKTVLCDFENPGNENDKINEREDSSQAYYEKFTGTSSSTSSNTSSSTSDTTITSETTTTSESSYQIVVANVSTTTTTSVVDYSYVSTTYYDSEKGYYNGSQYFNTPASENESSQTSYSVTTTSKAFQSALANYTLYFDFLWALLVNSNDPELIEDLTSLVLDNDDTSVKLTIYTDAITNDPTVSSASDGTYTLTETVGTEGLISVSEDYNKTRTTTTTTTSKTSKLAITQANTWLMDYENDASTYEEYQAKTCETITEKTDPDSTENNVIKILKSNSERLSTLTTESYIVEGALENNAKVSFMIEIYEYILDIANNGGSEENSLSEILDVSSFDVNSFVSTNTTVAIGTGTGTGTGANGGTTTTVATRADGLGYTTTFTTGDMTFKEYKQGASEDTPWYATKVTGWTSQPTTMGHLGCFLTSIAVIATGYGVDIDPQDVADLVNSGAYAWDQNVQILKYYIGKSCYWVETDVEENIIAQLKSGKPCMVKTTGHCLTILAYNEDTQEVYVSDVGGWWDGNESKNGWQPISKLSEYSGVMIIED